MERFFKTCKDYNAELQDIQQQNPQLMLTLCVKRSTLVPFCRYGHYDIVKYLIERCGADVNLPGVVVFDDKEIEDASPLWCAAAAGHLDLVVLLVQYGAKLNSTTKTYSTPLRAACFDGYYEIVKYLVRRGADIEIANRHGHTSLMIACYKGHTKIVKFLLDRKAQVNRKSESGGTALHDCAESGSLEIAKMLIEHGARMCVDSDGVSPLLAAALAGYKNVYEYFISIPNLVSRKERIDALELLGATYVDKNEDMMGAFDLWKRAMDERYRDDCPVLYKPPSTAIAAYNFAKEVTDADSLNELLNDPDQIRMQALVIRERILGLGHPDTIYYIRQRGAVYGDGGIFDRCIKLWNHALDSKQSILRPLDETTLTALLCSIQVFSTMIDRQQSSDRTIPPIQNEGLVVFKKTVLQVKLGKQMLDTVPFYERNITHLNEALMIALRLASLLTHEMPEENTEKHKSLFLAIHKLVRIKAKGTNDSDLMHLIFSRHMIGIGPKSPTYRSLSPQLLKALIKTGADVSAKDKFGDTPLHKAAMFDAPSDLITILLDAGAHIDAVNKTGRTFESSVKDRRQYEAVYPVRYITLSCLAARVIRKTYNDTIFELVPNHLRDFLQMH
ncbi:PREDICTED: protein fem-1 homolog CG6966 isoform X2 [Habropoda laboriosa]|uniref:protein fem-1 homolog CG6966 isoform X2 n=1 Tax=Habropoda laboriosa TaxID=597456 RepID=UPI00083DDAE1|nr:PREDICTED: protein fem-1 homolog CG6966 isoform X2 [Habropoda laboriosa]XP_017797609.1 PREDICTED: protein fem-1 homolog CG6966 isoform X2 [Habropoda laboriosa]